MSDFKWEYFLRQYIDIAVRWNIGDTTVRALGHYFTNVRGEWEKFVKDFRRQKSNLNETERKSLYEDLESDFFQMIDMYLLWFENNKATIKQKIFDRINPYSVLAEFCNDTKREIGILNKNPLRAGQESGNSKNAALNKYLNLFTQLITEMVPEPFDVAYIESRVKHIDKLKYEFADIRLTLWDRLEAVLMSDLAENVRIGFLQRFYEKFEEQYSIFNSKYNRQSLNGYSSDQPVYTSQQSRENANVVFGMLENDRHILYVFNEDYQLPFPAPQIVLENNVMTNQASPEYKQLFEKLVKLKPAWDKLKDYNSKLRFWMKNALSYDEWSYFIGGDSETKNLPENCITIYPFKREEIPVWKKFYYNNFNKYNFNTLATSKQKYAKHIEQGADPIPFTNNVLKQLDEEYARNEKLKLDPFKYYCIGYKASQNGQIKDFLNNYYFSEHLFSMREFCTGAVHEQYRRFLAGKLKELETPAIVRNTSERPPKIAEAKHFGWSGNVNLLRTIYRKLRESQCIAKDTNINTFLFAFTEKPANATKKPIVWIKSNRLLAYMLFLLNSNKKISKEWQSIAGNGKYFKNKKGKNITANDLAKAVSDCEKFEIRPDYAYIIDNIIGNHEHK